MPTLFGESALAGERYGARVAVFEQQGFRCCGVAVDIDRMDAAFIQGLDALYGGVADNDGAGNGFDTNGAVVWAQASAVGAWTVAGWAGRLLAGG